MQNLFSSYATEEIKDYIGENKFPSFMKAFEECQKKGKGCKSYKIKYKIYNEEDTRTLYYFPEFKVGLIEDGVIFSWLTFFGSLEEIFKEIEDDPYLEKDE
jgi:hypothetical protein